MWLTAIARHHSIWLFGFGTRQAGWLRQATCCRQRKPSPHNGQHQPRTAARNQRTGRASRIGRHRVPYRSASCLLRASCCRRGWDCSFAGPLWRVQETRCGSALGAEMNHNQQHGLAISTPILRADAGKNACAASHGVKLVPACFHVASKEQDSAPPVSIPSASIDGLPCVDLPDANLAGGGISNRPQSFSFK